MAEAIEVLLHEAAYRRQAEGFAALGAGVRPLLIRDDGSLIRPDGTPAEDAIPTATFLSVDVFAGPRRRYVALVEAAPALRWLHSASAGLDFALFGTVAARGGRVTTSTATAPGIAEYVMATVLDAFQRGPERRAAQAAHRWERLRFREVAGSRWVIVGFGAIGREVALRARAFGAQVTGVRRSGGSDPLADEILTPARLRERLPEADVVVLALPLTPDNRGMVNADFLAALTPGRTVLVNVARGGHVNEAALIAGLAAERPVHAILDVFAREPLPADSPFWDHPQVSLTAHAAPWSDGLIARGDAQFLANLHRFVAGEPLLNEASAAEIHDALAASDD